MDVAYPCPVCNAMMPFNPDAMRAHRFELGHEVRVLICEPCPVCKSNIVLANILEYSQPEQAVRQAQQQGKDTAKNPPKAKARKIWRITQEDMENR